MPAPRGILTLATGRPAYLDMALDLARSAAVHSPSLPRCLVTEAGRDDPRIDRLFTHRVDFDPALGDVFEQQTRVLCYTPFDETIFIDGDCLVAGPIEPLFGLFAGRDVGYAGEKITAGHWYADVAAVRERYGLGWLPKHNGGSFYCRRTDAARRVFDRANALFAEYDDVGFSRMRSGAPSAEPTLAVAYAEAGIGPIADDAGFMFTPERVRGRVRMDVIGGGCRFDKGGRIVTPAIVHFSGPYKHHPVYRYERLRLNLMDAPPGERRRRLIPAWLAAQAGEARLIAKHRARRLLGREVPAHGRRGKPPEPAAAVRPSHSAAPAGTTAR